MSNASVLGELSVDFADCAEATNSSCVSFPLKNSTIMHVSTLPLCQNCRMSDNNLIAFFLSNSCLCFRIGYHSKVASKC